MGEASGSNPEHVFGNIQGNEANVPYSSEQFYGQYVQYPPFTPFPHPEPFLPQTGNSTFVSNPVPPYHSQQSYGDNVHQFPPPQLLTQPPVPDPNQFHHLSGHNVHYPNPYPPSHLFSQTGTSSNIFHELPDIHQQQQQPPLIPFINIDQQQQAKDLQDSFNLTMNLGKIYNEETRRTAAQQGEEQPSDPPRNDQLFTQSTHVGQGNEATFVNNPWLDPYQTQQSFGHNVDYSSLPIYSQPYTPFIPQLDENIPPSTTFQSFYDNPWQQAIPQVNPTEGENAEETRPVDHNAPSMQQMTIKKKATEGQIRSYIKSKNLGSNYLQIDRQKISRNVNCNICYKNKGSGYTIVIYSEDDLKKIDDHLESEDHKDALQIIFF